MSVSREALFEHGEMSGAGSDVSKASGMLELLENTEARRKRVTVGEARKVLARALRVPATTLRNIRTQRRKLVENSLLTGIRDRLVQVLLAEVADCEHEIAIAMQIGVDCREDLFVEAQNSIAAAKEILARAIGPG